MTTRIVPVGPFVIDALKFDIIDDEVEALFKLELLGIPHDKAYKANPVLDPISITNVGQSYSMKKPSNTK